MILFAKFSLLDEIKRVFIGLCLVFSLKSPIFLRIPGAHIPLRKKKIVRVGVSGLNNEVQHARDLKLKQHQEERKATCMVSTLLLPSLRIMTST